MLEILYYSDKKSYVAQVGAAYLLLEWNESWRIIETYFIGTFSVRGYKMLCIQGELL